MQRSALCRSRRELSNEYFLANFGFDTAENDPLSLPDPSRSRSPDSRASRRAVTARRSRAYQAAGDPDQVRAGDPHRPRPPEGRDVARAAEQSPNLLGASARSKLN